MCAIIIIKGKEHTTDRFLHTCNESAGPVKSIKLHYVLEASEGRVQNFKYDVLLLILESPYYLFLTQSPKTSRDL